MEKRNASARIKMGRNIMLKHYIFKYKNFGSAPSGSPLGIIRARKKKAVRVKLVTLKMLMRAKQLAQAW